MNVRDAIKSLRDDYVGQFDAMVAHQRAKRPDVYVERRMERTDSGLFGKIYVPDVSFGDPMTDWLDMVPRQRAGALPSFSLNAPNLTVSFEDLWWDDVRLDTRRGVYRKASQLVVQSLDSSGRPFSTARRRTEWLHP